MSTTLTALSSVARLSFSMTMSMSSGLFSMADEDGGGSSAGGDGRPTRRLSWGGGGVEAGGERRTSMANGLFLRLTRRSGQMNPQAIPFTNLGRGRRGSIAVTGVNLSEGDSQSSVDSSSRPRTRSRSPPPSPPNSSGVRIIIDQGSAAPSVTSSASDQDLEVTQSETEVKAEVERQPEGRDQDDCLQVDRSYMAELRRSSDTSESSQCALLQ